MSADEFDRDAADDGMETREKAEHPVRVSDEAVEKAARAMNLEAGRQRGLAFEDDWHTLTEQERGGWRLCARAALSAALPVIERDLREKIAQEIEATDAAGQAWSRGLVVSVAARIREGGRA